MYDFTLLWVKMMKDVGDDSGVEVVLKEQLKRVVIHALDERWWMRR